MTVETSHLKLFFCTCFVLSILVGAVFLSLAMGVLDFAVASIANQVLFVLVTMLPGQMFFAMAMHSARGWGNEPSAVGSNFMKLRMRHLLGSFLWFCALLGAVLLVQNYQVLRERSVAKEEVPALDGRDGSMALTVEQKQELMRQLYTRWLLDRDLDLYATDCERDVRFISYQSVEVASEVSPCDEGPQDLLSYYHGSLLPEYAESGHWRDTVTDLQFAEMTMTVGRLESKKAVFIDVGSTGMQAQATYLLADVYSDSIVIGQDDVMVQIEAEVQDQRWLRIIRETWEFRLNQADFSR